jgi:hypothetical protein
MASIENKENTLQTKNPQTPLTRFAETATPEQLQDILKKVSELGAIGANDPIWDALGVLTMATQSAELIDGAVRYLPQELSKIWDIEAVNRQKHDANLIAKIGNLKIQVTAPPANKNLERVAVGLGGIIIGSILSGLVMWIFAVPALVNVARGKDAPIINWLQTDEGALVRKIVDKHKTSLTDCSIAASKAGVKKKKGDLPCLLNLR